MAPHADLTLASLPAHSAPVVEGRTQFPSTVVDVRAVDRVLVSGHNNPKLGRRVTRGRWAGMPIYHLTLEERATCPPTCGLWRACYGNAMHLARRHRHGPDLERRLGADLWSLTADHPRGFVVRLHTLGDFYSIEYAARWANWIGMHPELRVFGFTAHDPDSDIGRFVQHMNAQHPDRCAIRFSRTTPAGSGMEATTIWRQAEAPVVPEGIVCPAQTGARDCCGTCGMCWAGGARARTIVFVGHGKRSTGGGRPRRQEKPPMQTEWPPGELDRRLAQSPPDGWTTAQWRTCCEMLCAGKSYGAVAIATRLTKNVVIGIARRRGLPLRPSPIARVLTPEERKRGAAASRTAHPHGGAREVDIAQERTARAPATGSSTETPVEMLRRLRDNPKGGRARTCRWPIGEPGTAAFRFCDRADVVPEKPYCSEHCALAYVPCGHRAA